MRKSLFIGEMAMIQILFLSLFLLISLQGITQGRESSGREALFPFVLPWNDTSSGPTDLKSWNHFPKGKLPPVKVGKDGHLYAGGRRIRFLGVNLCFGACFPSKEASSKIAGRMAKFGINCVRFHHMDMNPFPNGIRAKDRSDTRNLDPEALDRLDYLIAQLKHYGIYSNLNLLVSRPFNHFDGLPQEIEEIDWKERHIIGFFYRPILELQKEYARKLLTHRNPYTGNPYTREPAIAFVEINNENGLIHSWLGGQVDRLPQIFLQDLQRQWNQWLQRRYRSTQALKTAWGVHSQPLGPELLSNGDFAEGTLGWNLEQHFGALATLQVVSEGPQGVPALRIESQKLGSEGWHLQLNQAGLRLSADQPYTLRFWAKSDLPCRISVGIGQAHSPWQSLGFDSPIELTPQWQEYHFTFLLSQGDNNARINFTGLSQQRATYWLAQVSLKPGGVVGLSEKERLEAKSIPIFLRSRWGERTPQARKDWLRFLWDTENQYWQTLYRYLKQELRVQALVIGTIIGCSTPHLMNQLDVLDTHSYWQHPHFPGRPWDPENWFVGNRSMVNERGGTLPGLALRRALHKPHLVTEYNHSAPNTFSSEAYLLLSAYAALQDWDGIFAFAYSHRQNRWDTQAISNFFDIDQHPTKMVTLPTAAALFRRGDVTPAQKQIIVPLTLEKELDLLQKSYAWQLVNAGQLGIPGEASLIHKIAMDLSGKGEGSVSQELQGLRQRNLFVADNKQLVWDLSQPGRGVVIINTSRTKGVIGYAGGRVFDLGGIRFKPGQTLQEGWCTLTLTLMEGKDLYSPKRILITATGYAENTGMKWKNPEKSSVGRDWGGPPSRVEGIPAEVILPLPTKKVTLWALDERGQRKAKIPLQSEGEGKTRFSIGPEWRTLWYELEVR